MEIDQQSTSKSRLTKTPGCASHHGNRVLASLPQSDLILLAPLLRVASAAEHDYLPRDWIYFPHEGLVSLLAVTPNGETIEIASAGRGDAICPVIESDLRDRLLLGPIAMRASRVQFARLTLVVSSSETLSRALEVCHQKLLLQMQQNLVCAGLHPAEQRLSRWLMEAADRMESDVIPITQDDVAQRLGVRRTTVTLMAGKLQEIGAINWRRSRVDILDRTLLQTECCTCYSELRERITVLSPRDTISEKATGA